MLHPNHETSPEALAEVEHLVVVCFPVHQVDDRGRRNSKTMNDLKMLRPTVLETSVFSLDRQMIRCGQHAEGADASRRHEAASEQ